MRFLVLALSLAACSPAVRTNGGGAEDGLPAGGGGGDVEQPGQDGQEIHDPTPGGEGQVDPDAGGEAAGGDGGEDPDPMPFPDPDPDPGPDPDPEPEPDRPPFGSWIGGPCRNAQDCEYADSACISAQDGFPEGTCTVNCDRFCPDQDGEPVTFCVGVEGAGGAGSCVSRCDRAVYPGDGCRDGYDCFVSPRFGEADVRFGVCLPEDDGGDAPGDPDPEVPLDGECIDEALRRGLDIRGTDERRSSPAGREDLECRQPEPLFLSSPVNGVNWRYFSHDDPGDMFMACRLALALDQFGDLLRELDIVEVEHLGVFNCRLIGGTDSLSEHGYGRAIDLSVFIYDDGTRCSVEDDWDSLNGNPDDMSLCGRLLHDVAWELHLRGIFNVILTPDFNAAHFNHFHVDLTPDGGFLG